MNSKKFHCTACGAPIQQITAEQRRGLCIPCFRAITAIPPDDYEIPSDLAERIIAMGRKPADYWEMTWKEGADFVHGFLDKAAQAEDLYATWAPRLREFAAACRASNPSPTQQSLSRERTCTTANIRIENPRLRRSPASEQKRGVDLQPSAACDPDRSRAMARRGRPVRIADSGGIVTMGRAVRAPRRRLLVVHSVLVER